MTVILGINAYHGDSAACVVVDGTLRAAVEEERFRRVKHWAGFPKQAIAYCLDAAGLSLGDVEYDAINSDPSAHLLKKIGFLVRKRPEFRLVLQRLKNAKDRVSLPQEFERAFPGSRFQAQVRRVEHHLAHLASAYYAGPFAEASVVSVDGFGDFSSGAWGRVVDGAIEVADRVYFPHSLGVFYQALTQYLGFPN